MRNYFLAFIFVIFYFARNLAGASDNEIICHPSPFGNEQVVRLMPSSMSSAENEMNLKKNKIAKEKEQVLALAERIALSINEDIERKLLESTRRNREVTNTTSYTLDLNDFLLKVKNAIVLELTNLNYDTSTIKDLMLSISDVFQSAMVSVEKNKDLFESKLPSGQYYLPKTKRFLARNPSQLFNHTEDRDILNSGDDFFAILTPALFLVDAVTGKGLRVHNVRRIAQVNIKDYPDKMEEIGELTDVDAYSPIKGERLKTLARETVRAVTEKFIATSRPSTTTRTLNYSFELARGERNQEWKRYRGFKKKRTSSITPLPSHIEFQIGY